MPMEFLRGPHSPQCLGYIQLAQAPQEKYKTGLTELLRSYSHEASGKLLIRSKLSVISGLPLVLQVSRGPLYKLLIQKIITLVAQVAL